MTSEFLNPEKPDIWFTMGPESNNPYIIQDIFEAGATGVRLTFSFGSQELQSQRSKMVTRAAKAANSEATIVADFEGEEMRLADFPGFRKISVESGSEVKLTFNEDDFAPETKSIPVKSIEFPDRVKEGDRILIGDGSVILDVVNKYDDYVSCEVSSSGIINPNRGIVIQDSEFEPKSLTEKDKADLKYVADKKEFDAIALSFVSHAEEVERAREILQSKGANLPIVSKVETPKALQNIRGIAKASDAIMVARGDLALFLPWQELGVHTQRIVSETKAVGTPWIMATQMAEGLERFAFPTRAEICDLTRWVNSGMDGMLLSYETAFGSHPVKAASTMREIIDTVEGEIK